MNGLPFSHYITVAVVALFPGFRRGIGIIGLVCLIVGGWMAYVAYYAPVAVAVNADPVCNRVAFRPLSDVPPPAEWGPITVTTGASGQQEWYIREAKGTGWCLLHRSPYQHKGVNGNLWSETPSKYGQRVQANADVQHHELSAHNWMIIGILTFSLILLFGIWLPSTIIAAAGRRFLKDVKEEPL